MLERRSEKRFRLGLEAVFGAMSGYVAVALRTRDVSSAGAFLCRESPSGTGEPLREGEAVRVDIFLPTRSMAHGRHMSVIHAEGRVVRQEKAGLAVRFLRKCRLEPVRGNA